MEVGWLPLAIPALQGLGRRGAAEVAVRPVAQHSAPLPSALQKAAAVVAVVAEEFAVDHGGRMLATAVGYGEAYSLGEWD